jgi:DNA-binding XRE family transcriptional regulator
MKLKEIRFYLGSMSQRELGKKAGLHQTTICNIENEYIAPIQKTKNCALHRH